ncbi:MAG: dCMP deaminase family protein [Planctomycetota bacterium]|nr:dCMP deaminase family protein [Planctomycetota bacterium]MDA1105873.1 dCMP deaminase family protein [Planctomycetota bacterium]
MSIHGEKWDRRFLMLAEQIGTWSKDPSRGVGAVIVAPSRRVVSTGYNGLPQGVHDHEDRLQRPAKYELTCHAELNAILTCARHGASPEGCSVYTTFSPCVACSLAIIQAGIKEVVCYEVESGCDAAWMDSIAKARTLFGEAAVAYVTYARE